jgi:hypothetical protein
MKTSILKTGLFTCFAAGALFSASASANLVIKPNLDGSFNPKYEFPGAGNDCANKDAAGSPFKDCSINGSPIIAKFNTEPTDDNPTGWEYNKAVWSSISGDEFSVKFEDGSWKWTYTPTSPDPLIKWVVAKQGSGFTAFYLPGATSGSWVGDLSHFSFYDTANPVPLPAAAWLLGSGLLGLFAVGRRRKGAAAAAA